MATGFTDTKNRVQYFQLKKPLPLKASLNLIPLVGGVLLEYFPYSKAIGPPIVLTCNSYVPKHSLALSTLDYLHAQETA